MATGTAVEGAAGTTAAAVAVTAADAGEVRDDTSEEGPMPDADDFDVEHFRKLLKGDNGREEPKSTEALEKPKRAAIVKQGKPAPKPKKPAGR